MKTKEKTRSLALGVYVQENLVELSWIPGIASSRCRHLLLKVMLLIGYRRGAKLFMTDDEKWCGIIFNRNDLLDVLKLLIKLPKERAKVIKAANELWQDDPNKVYVWSGELRHVLN